MYAVLALLAAVENVVPPVPSDAAVALGAFLSHRGLTSPPLVFLVTWTANLLGAAGVYFAARRYGRRLFATGTGRRLLAPRSLAVIEREYMRFGVAGIFISRFLPGVRAVVPPFAGLVDLGWIRTLGPMGLASAIWYGGITMVGALLGAEWEPDRGHHRRRESHARHRRGGGGGRGRDLVLARPPAAEAGAGLARDPGRARHPRRPRSSRAPSMAEGSAREAAALLVLELAYADPVLTPRDRQEVAEHLRERWGLQRRDPPARPQPEDERRSRFADYAATVRKRFGRSERLELVERMWTRRVQRRGCHRRPRGSVDVHLRPSFSAWIGPKWPSVSPAPQPATEPAMTAADSRRGALATSGSRASATSSASRRGTAENTVEAYLRDLRRMAEFAAGAGGAGAGLRSPARTSAISSTCSRTWGSAPRRSGARCPPSGPTTAFWSARVGCAPTPATGWSRPPRAGSCPTR